MSYESGTITTRIFGVPRPLPQDAIARFLAGALPAIESLSDGTIHGWVTGRHLLDRNITDDTATYGGFLRLALVQAEKKVPEKLLRAECKMEELAQMQAQGIDRLSGSARREIRRSIEARMQPHAQPTLKEIPFVYDQRAEIIYAGAMSNRQIDAFQLAFAQTCGFSLVPLTPEMAAAKYAKTNARDWEPTSFSSEREEAEVSHDPGMDFLAWLWFVAEARGGQANIPNVGNVSMMLEGPLQFHIEGGGAHDVAIRKGEPLLSASAKTALLSGMKPCRAKITLATGEHFCTFTLDAPTFGIRGLKLPEVEKGGKGERIKLDAISFFQARMESLEQFRAMFYGLFAMFATERTDPAKWNATVREMQNWISNRKSR